MSQHTKQAAAEALYNELLHIHSVLRLAAFAVEAERELMQIEYGAKQDSQLDRLLNAWVDRRKQWTEYAGAAPMALDGVRHQIGVLLDLEG